MPVPLFVMVTHDWRYGIRKINTTENLRSHGGVDLHLIKLCRCQTARFVDDVGGNGELADVMKQGSGFKCTDLRDAETQNLAEAGRVNLHPAHVAMRCLIFRVYCRGKRFGSGKVHAAELFGLTRFRAKAKPGEVNHLRAGKQCDAQESK